MNEATLTRGLVKHLRASLPNSVIFKHADAVTAGIPDISVSWFGSVSWLEIKYVHPQLLDRGIQALTLKALARANGSTWYVLFVERHGVKATQIVNPWDLDAVRQGQRAPFMSCHGHQFGLVEQLIRKTHETRAGGGE